MIESSSRKIYSYLKNPFTIRLTLCTKKIPLFPIQNHDGIFINSLFPLVLNFSIITEQAKFKVGTLFSSVERKEKLISL